MSEWELTDGPESRGGAEPLSPANLLTPKARAIAGFAFAVFGMLGQGTWSMAVTTLFWGTSYAEGNVPNVMMAWGLGCVVMAGLGAWLARGTLRVSHDTWDSHLARAAVLVAAVGAVLGVLTIVGGFLHAG